MTTSTTYSPSFRRYLDDLFIPAQDWVRSKEGISWIAANIPSLIPLVTQNYDDCLFAVYAIELNGRPLYIGESIRTVRRLIVHAYNIYTHPQLFGLDRGLGINTVTFKLLETSLYDKAIRKATELHYISVLKPLLQAGNGTDRCIPRRERSAAISPYYKETL